MKKTILVCILFIYTAIPADARDFIVKFVSENYNEARVQFSYHPLIYHSIQVETNAGPKVIILKGDDYTYRTWVRHYIADNRKLILRVDDEKNDEFIASKAFEISVNSVHPVQKGNWSFIDSQKAQGNALPGGNYILVIETDENKANLISTIAKEMGYKTAIYKKGQNALHPFKLQPEKFSMVIASHEILKKDKDNFVDRILKIDQTVPILIETGYNNKDIKKKYEAKYSDFSSVHIKTMVLKELTKTIEKLRAENV